MSMLDAPPLPCTDCGRLAYSACKNEACDEPLCNNCVRRNHGQCADCAEAAAERRHTRYDYERSAL